jgi:hypothetical protein
MRECMKRVSQFAKVVECRIDMCAYGMNSWGENGEKSVPVREPTKFLTNSECMCKYLNNVCSGGHDHVALRNNRAVHAAVYPPRLVKATCMGVRDQFDMMGVDVNDWVGNSDCCRRIMEIEDESDCIELPGVGITFWDDVNGKVLDTEGVRKARQDEIEFVKKMSLYKVVPVSECYQKTGKAPIRTRWVDSDKGEGKLRSRLVAMDLIVGRWVMK